MSEALAPAPHAGEPVRIVLVGFGPVGARFTEGLLDAVRAGTVQLSVVGAEGDPAYNRVLLAEYAVGRADRERLDLLDVEAALEAGVELRLGEAAVELDRGRQLVHLSSGSSLRYDRLVLATGARANVPTLLGLEGARHPRGAAPAGAEALDRGTEALPDGVVALRDLADAARVRDAVQAGRRVVVLGAGVLGMELALAAAEQGAEVVVVHHGDVPMGRNLDTGGGRLLTRAARAGGVTMLAHSRAEAVMLKDAPLLSGALAPSSAPDAWQYGPAPRRFHALVCADGKTVEGDLLVLSCGVGARAELAERSGLAVSAGILVDEELRSWTDPDIHAIGDCAQLADPAGHESRSGVVRVPGAPSGLIGPGWRQADWLAATLAADAAAVAAAAPASRPALRTAERPALLATERPAVVMLKAEGVDVVSGGDVAAELWDEHPETHTATCRREVTQWADPARGHYLKLVTRGGVLEGFVSVGLARAGAELTLLFERGSEVPADRTALLALDGSGEPSGFADTSAPDATVCWCNGVSVQQITDAVAAGNDTVACISSATRAGTGCGGCRGRITELLATTTGTTAPTTPASTH